MKGVTVKHRFTASAERVYDAWLDPDTARRFLFATATGEIVRCDIDARPGGRYAIVDRRGGEDVLHEGTYLSLERPKRIVFTLRVPKYSPDEDRVTIHIEPLAHGCEVTLSTETPEQWIEDTRRGWTTIVHVLDDLLPGDTPSCGAGLAQHASVPQHIAVYLAELATTLELHRSMLVQGDPHAENEDAVYGDLAARYRNIAGALEEAATRMAAQYDLPMGAHDEGKWTDGHMRAFGRFVHAQGALASLLRVAVARDEQMLASMRQPPN